MYYGFKGVFQFIDVESRLYKILIDIAEKNYNKEDYKAAIQELKKLEKYFKNDSTYSSNLDKYKNEFINQQLPEAEKLFDDKKYNEALEAIESVILVVGSSKELSEKKEEFKKAEEEFKKKRKEQLLSKTVSFYDDIQEVTYIAPKGLEPKFVDVKKGKTSFYPRLHISGDYAQLIVTSGFGQDDWVFTEKIIFNLDGERVTWDLEYGERGSEVSGGIYEWVVRGSLLYPHILTDIEKIVNAKDSKMRFQGDRQRDYTITEDDKERFKLFLELFTYYKQFQF